MGGIPAVRTVGARLAAGGTVDPGFTLVELLVVMIVIGILAAIAVPVFFVQRGKAADAATKRDLVSVAKIVIAAFTAGGPAPTVRIVGGQYQVDAEVVGPVSSGVTVSGADPATADVTGWTENAWCLSFTNAGGNVGAFKYSAQQGLQQGTCTAPTVP